MTHKHKEVRHTGESVTAAPKSPAESRRPKLELVIKADSAGSLEALVKSISEMTLPEVDISLIHSSVGDVNKSDVLMAETGSRLIIGFQVDPLPGIESLLREHRVEVRLFNMIYSITANLGATAETLGPPVLDEQVIGSAKVIALFKSSRRGIIIGCEVLGGHLAVGQRFRIVSAMGPVYSGHIESMHIEEKTVQKATPGQRVGIKIKGFSEAKTGDLVESFRPLRRVPVWVPVGEVIRR